MQVYTIQGVHDTRLIHETFLHNSRGWLLTWQATNSNVGTYKVANYTILSVTVYTAGIGMPNSKHTVPIMIKQKQKGLQLACKQAKYGFTKNSPYIYYGVYIILVLTNYGQLLVYISYEQSYLWPDFRKANIMAHSKIFSIKHYKTLVQKTHFIKYLQWHYKGHNLTILTPINKP